MNWHTIQKHLYLNPDGIPGTNTAKAIGKMLNIPQHDWKSIQIALKIPADGIPGTNTAKAVGKTLGIFEEKTTKTSKWPTQAEVRNNTSRFGAPGNAVPLVSIPLPYTMKLSWDISSEITKISCHELIAESVHRIFEEAYKYYGGTRISQLGLDLYGGCFNDRKIIGGASKSMHSWGIAIDLDPDHNGLSMHKPKARFSAMEFAPFWEIVENEGGVSLGREKDYDWMHFQFARL